MTQGKNIWEQASRRLGAACVSDLQIDQILTGELAQAAKSGVLAHLSACPACAAAQARLVADRTVFETDAPMSALAADALLRAANETPRVSAGAWWRRLLPATTLIAGVAAAAFVLIPRPAEQGGRTKGQLSISVFVQGANGVGVPHAGQALHPGDRVRFQIASAEAGYLTVLGLDERKQVSVYFPSGPQAAAVAAGAAELLPNAVELDESLGRELVLAVRCAAPVAVSDVQAAARRAIDGAGGGALPSLALPCAQVRYSMTKVATTPTP